MYTCLKFYNRHQQTYQFIHHVFAMYSVDSMDHFSQAEMGEGLMMVSYGYSGAGKTTTLCLGRSDGRWDGICSPKNIYQVNTFHYWFMMIMMIHLAISLDKSGSCSAKKRMMRMKLRHSIWQRPGDTEYTGRSPVSHQIPTMGPRPRTGSEDWWCYCTSRRRNWYRWCFVPLPQGEFPEDRRTLATGCHTMWQNIYSVPSHIFGYAR